MNDCETKTLSAFDSQNHIFHVSKPSLIINLIGSCVSFVIGIIYLIILKLMNQHPTGSQLKSGSERLLSYLTISDLLRVLACIIGLVRYYIRYFYFDMTYPCPPDWLCQLQSFLLIEASIASSFWIVVIGFYYYSRIFNMDDDLDSVDSKQWYLSIHILCWGLPAVIALTTAANGGLGEDLGLMTTAGWCWIRWCDHQDGSRINFWAITGRLEEMGATFFCLLIWFKFKYSLIRKNRRLRIMQHSKEDDLLREVLASSRQIKRFENSMISSTYLSQRNLSFNVSRTNNLHRPFPSTSSQSFPLTTSPPNSLTERSLGGGVHPEEIVSMTKSELFEKEIRDFCLQHGCKYYPKLCSITERNFFAILIFFFYLTRLTGFVRFICAIIILTSDNKPSWIVGLSQGCLYIQGSSECLVIIFNFLLLIYVSQQARDVFISLITRIILFFRVQKVETKLQTLH